MLALHNYERKLELVYYDVCNECLGVQEQTGTVCLITPCLAPSFGNSVVFVSPLKSPVLPPFSRESHFHVSCHWRSSIDSLQALSLQYALYTYRDPGLKLGYSMDARCVGKGSRCSLCAGCSRVSLLSTSPDSRH